MSSAIALPIPQFTSGKLAILIDDAASPGRAVLVAPAQNMAADVMNRAISLARGHLFVALPPERVRAFVLEEMGRPSSLPPSLQQAVNGDEIRLRGCISVEAREGVTTGISAADRAITVSILGELNPNPRKLVKPGHVFPVQVRDGGVLMKTALPEGALDLVRAAGFTEAAVYFDLLGPEGELLDEHGAARLAADSGIPKVLLTDLIRHRLSTETLVERVAEARLPTHAAGELRSIIYRSKIHSGDHLALVKGEIDPDQPILTRVQPEFTLSDVFGGSNPPSRETLHRSLEAIGKRGSGVLVYLRRPTIGELTEAVAAAEPIRPPPAAHMMREYGLGAQILRDLGVRKIELLTGTSRSLAGLGTFGIEIVAQHPIPDL